MQGEVSTLEVREPWARAIRTVLRADFSLKGESMWGEPEGAIVNAREKVLLVNRRFKRIVG